MKMPTLDEAYRRHVAGYLALAEEAEAKLTESQQTLWLNYLESSYANFRIALEWLLDQPEDAENPLRLAGALWQFWMIRGYLSEGRYWLGSVLAISQTKTVSAFIRAKALMGAGILALKQDDYQQAKELLEKARALWLDARDKGGLAYTLINLGIVAEQQGDYIQAEFLFKETLALRLDIQDMHGAAWALNNLGMVALDRADYAQAIHFFERSLAIFQNLQVERGISQVLTNLGWIALETKDFGRAKTLFEQSLRLCKQLKDKSGIANNLSNLGMVAYQKQNNTGAVDAFRESLLVFEEIGNKRGIAECLEGLASASSAMGMAQYALQLFGIADVLRETINAPLWPIARVEHEQKVNLARAQVSQEEFEIAWAKGRAMTLEQVIHFFKQASIGNEQ